MFKSDQMTYYQSQVISIRKNFFPKDHLFQQVIRARNFIDSHFAENIGLTDMAGEAFFSKFHFLRAFKLAFGRTPHQYLTSVRIEKARQLLQAGLPATDVCFSVGFDSVSSFKLLFKKHTGFTPASFRQQAKITEIPGTSLRFLPFFFSLKKSNFQDSEKNKAADLCLQP